MLERRVAATLASLSSKKTGPSAGPSDEQVDYLLKTIPYIKQYYESAPAPAAGPLAPFCSVDGKTQRNVAYNNYLLHVEKDEANVAWDCLRETVSVRDTYTCPSCNVLLLSDHSTDELVCPSCAVVTKHNSMNLTYDQEQNSTTLITSFTYKRLNHLTETLSSVCNVKEMDVPADMLEAVRNEYSKMRVLRPEDITPKRTKQIMKKLDLNKYYFLKYAINYRLGGPTPPQISRELFQEFQRLFLFIQKPFERICPPKRTNFLSYHYTCYQLAKIVGRPDLAPWFQLLKSTSNLRKQDVMWKAICEDTEVNWPFHPTC